MSDLLFRELLTVDSITELKLIRPNGLSVVLVLGKNAIGDGWSGNYRWDAASTVATSDDAVASSVVSPTGRWLRVKNRIDTLFLRMIQTKRVATPAMLIGATSNVSVTWDVAFANTNYTVSVTLEGASLLGLTPVISSRTATGCVVTIRNSLLVNLLVNAGTLHLIATADL